MSCLRNLNLILLLTLLALVSTAYPQCPPIYTFTGEEEHEYYGRVSDAGDVNNDGYDDFIIAAPNNGPGNITYGAVYVFSGQTGDTIYAFTGDEHNGRFGSSISGAGDVNNDGFDDIIIGSHNNDTNGDRTGAAFVFSGYSGDTLHAFYGKDYHRGFGWKVSGAGDTDNDGFDDLIISGADWSSGEMQRIVYIFSGLTGDTLYIFRGEMGGVDMFGESRPSAGDINNDGFSDIIIGARGYRIDDMSRGRVYVFSGQTGDTLFIFSGGPTDEGLGLSLSGAGDINGDGYDDIIVASGPIPSKAYVYSGSDGTTLYTLSGEWSDISGNFSVCMAGDVNNDGFADMIIGKDGMHSADSIGVAYIYSGQTGDILYFYSGNEKGDMFGQSISGAGDINKDSFADIIIGATWNNGNGENSGQVYVYSGRPCGLTIHVPSDYPTIQAGIDAAVPGDTVLVAPGTYVENISISKPNITLASMFISNEDSTYIGETVIDGDSSGTVITISETAAGTNIIGLTIQNGSAKEGGGIYSKAFGVTLENNHIISNFSEEKGGGIHSAGDSIHIFGNLIHQNLVNATPPIYWASGGGIYSAGLDAQIEGNIISNNESKSEMYSQGGGIGFTSKGGYIANNKITNNFATGRLTSGASGGGISAVADSITISNNTISGNTAVSSGGGIEFSYSNFDYSSINCSDNIIGNNTAAWGAGIRIRDANVSIISNTIIDNVATGSDGSNGGGIQVGYSHSRFIGNIIAGNSATSGGGGIASAGSNYLDSNLIYNNTSKYGGGINCYGDSIFNTTIIGNSAEFGAGIWKYQYAPPMAIQSSIVAFNSGNTEALYCDSVNLFEISCSDIYGNSGGDWVGSIADQANINGNFSTDPLFCDTANGDFHINSLSPCAPANNSCGVLIGALDVGCTGYAGPVWYVSTSGDDINGDGGESNPFATIQKGIDAAVTDGDTVLIHPGVYNENIKFKGKNIVVASLFILEEDTSFISQTVIDGQKDGSVVLITDGETTQAVLKGITIRNGLSKFGGGIHIRNASATLTNLIITGNTAAEGDGAGISCENSNSIIKNNLITDNTSVTYWGGGIYFKSSGGVIADNKITKNKAGSGGGLEIYMNSNPLIEGNIISHNTASSTTSGLGGGIILYTNCSPIMKDNIITDNYALKWGAGIFLHMGSNPTLINNTIVNNRADINAGGIFARYASHPTIENSILWNNTPQEIYCHDGNGVNNVTISCSNIDGGESGIVNGNINWLEGNMDTDPLFCDTANSDFHINSLSPCAPENSPCGELVGALGVWCEPQIQTIAFDIKPGSCPNPINIKDNGKGNSVIPAAITGTEDYDVHDIDVNSLRLAGIAPTRWRYEDEASPINSDDSCACTEEGPDGHDDLLLKFDRSAIIAAIMSHPEDLQLTITGLLNDSTQIEGHDCVEIRPKGNVSVDPVTGEIIIIYATGDVTGDGMVNLHDVATIIAGLYSQSPVETSDLSAGDVNCSENINLLDITCIINYLFKNGPEPECPQDQL